MPAFCLETSPIIYLFFLFFLLSHFTPPTKTSRTFTSFQFYSIPTFLPPQSKIPTNSDMSNPSGLEVQKQPPSPAPEADVEGGPTAEAGPSGFGMGSVLRRWRREDLMRKGSAVLRAMGLVFSLLSFIIMASNNHGDWREFGKYEEYRYLLAMAILSTLYTGGQCYRQFHQAYAGKDLLPMKTAALIDFAGDQIIAYLLLSSASSAIPLTNRMREGADNIFTDSSAAAISMSLLAFLVLACSSAIAGYKLSTQSYL